MQYERGQPGASIRVEDRGRQMRLVLPPRRIGRAWPVGLTIGLFGAFMMVFMGFWVGTPIAWALKSGSGGAWGGPVRVSVLGLPVLGVGLAMLVAGVAVATNRTRCEVFVSDRRLQVIERCGLLRWSFKRPVRTVEELVVSDRAGRITSDSGRPIRLNSIIVRGGGTRPLFVGLGYPGPLLRELAQRLSDAMTVDHLVEPRPGDDEASASVRITAESASTDAPGGARLVTTQPAHSDAVIERRADGVTIVIPSAGLRKGSNGAASRAAVVVALA